jgi:hypothetical protein
MNSAANPLCFVSPLIKSFRKMRGGSGGGGGDDGNHEDRLANLGEDRLANLGLPWAFVHNPRLASVRRAHETKVLGTGWGSSDLEGGPMDTTYDTLWEAVHTRALPGFAKRIPGCPPKADRLVW